CSSTFPRSGRCAPAARRVASAGGAGQGLGGGPEDDRPKTGSPSTLVGTEPQPGLGTLEIMSGSAAPPAARDSTPEPPSLQPETPLPGPELQRTFGGRPRSARDWMADAGLLVLAIVGGALGYLAPLLQGASTPDLLLNVDLALGAAACLAVFLRRRWPVGLAVALVPVGIVSGASLGAQLVALFNVAQHRRLRTVLGVGVL